MAPNSLMVGIAECKIAKALDDILTASNLGSCLGVAAYDPKTKRCGMVHCLLPLSQADPEKAKNNPAMFVDTGVALLLQELIRSGAQKKDLVIVVAGGSNINDENNVFEIGKRNFTALRKILWKNNLLIKAEHVGGGSSRTLSLHAATGEVWLKTQGETIQLK